VRMLCSWNREGRGKKKGVEEQTRLHSCSQNRTLNFGNQCFIHSASGKQWNLKLETMCMYVL
jgi:hypothetical protein